MKLLERAKHDMREVLPPTVFFFLAFCLILATKTLILRQYGISWSGFGGALIGAGLVGKIVLLTDKLPFVNRFPEHPLIYNTLWKSLIYFLASLLVRYADHLAPLLWRGEGFGAANRLIVDEIVWPQFWLIQMWLAVLFLIYCALRELTRAIGRDRVARMFFGDRRAGA